MSRPVKRLRWWHRDRQWLGNGGWRYHWDGRGWIGENNHCPDDPIFLTRRHNTADYGPFRAIGLDRWGERCV